MQQVIFELYVPLPSQTVRRQRRMLGIIINASETYEEGSDECVHVHVHVHR